MEEILPDSTSDPARMYVKAELYDKLWAAFDALELEEQTMLAEHLGFCLKCRSTQYVDPKDKDEDRLPKQKLIPRMKYTDIATEHGYSDGQTVRRKSEQALEKIKKRMM